MTSTKTPTKWRIKIITSRGYNEASLNLLLFGADGVDLVRVLEDRMKIIGELKAYIEHLETKVKYMGLSSVSALLKQVEEENKQLRETLYSAASIGKAYNMGVMDCFNDTVNTLNSSRISDLPTFQEEKDVT